MDKIRLSLFLCALGVVSATQVACSSSLNEQLLEAVEEGDCAQVEQLLQAGVDANIIGIAGYTVLHSATAKGHERMVEQLLQAGADPNIADVKGYTALHLAASHGHEQVMERLLQDDANVHAATRSGETALRLAVFNGYESVVDRLLRAGADVNAVDVAGDAALHSAANCAIVQQLVQAGADFEVLNNQQESPLVRCVASFWKEEQIVAEMVGYLISIGAGIDDLFHSDDLHYADDLLQAAELREHLRPHVDLIKSRAAFLRDLLKGQGIYLVLEDLIGQYAGFPISKQAVGKIEAILLRDLIENFADCRMPEEVVGKMAACLQ